MHMHSTCETSTCTRLCNSNSEHSQRSIQEELVMLNKIGSYADVWVKVTHKLFFCAICQYFTLNHSCKFLLFCPHSAEIDQKLQEIMKQTGYLKIDGQVRSADLDIWCLSFVDLLQVITMSKWELELTRRSMYEEKILKFQLSLAGFKTHLCISSSGM